ncbi:hypothetical protein KFU94_20885 [Chloroflexi bacterium TSY]|nr:hypothetical protein [Chloroflexi bacterium TSY]
MAGVQTRFLSETWFVWGYHNLLDKTRVHCAGGIYAVSGSSQVRDLAGGTGQVPLVGLSAHFVSGTGSEHFSILGL